MSGTEQSLESCLMSEKATPQAFRCLGQRPGDMLTGDTLCPYPDEIIVSVLDRILYYAGATRVIHQLNLNQRKRKAVAKTATTPAAALTAKASRSSHLANCSSSSSLTQFVSAKSIGCYRSRTPSRTPSRTSSRTPSRTPSQTPSRTPSPSPSMPSKPSSLKSRCTVVMPPSCPRPRTPRVDFANPASDDRQTANSTLSDRMRQSISPASLTYRRLKSKLASNFKFGQKWLWTRLVRSEGGYHVYEVYTYDNPEHATHKKAGAKEPVVLFVVLPNGQVITFESLTPIVK